jgi:HEAT repeat protein
VIVLLLVALSTLVILAVMYITGGVAHDAWIRHAERRLARARRALAVVLFDDEVHAREAFESVRVLPRPWLLRAEQTVAIDLGDASHQRLCRVVSASGAARRIRRLARSRAAWKRMQAARLLHLVVASDSLRELLLRDRHPLVRARAVESLGPDDIVKHCALVVEMLDDHSRPVRIAAQQALLRSDGRVARELACYLTGPDHRGVTLALEVAAHRPDPRLSEPVTAHTGDDSSARRALVAQAVGTSSFVHGAQVLEPLLADDDAGVRAAAARSAGKIGAVELAARLGDLLSDRSWDVRREAGLALDALGAPGTAMLRAHLFDADRYARDMARQTLDAAATRRRLPQVMLPEALGLLRTDASEEVAS